MRRERKLAAVEGLEPRLTLSATVMEHDGVGYFLQTADPGFARYDIEAEQWLPRVDLADATGSASAAHIDEDGIYVAFGRSVYRYNLDGSNQTFLISLERNIHRIHSEGNLLFLNRENGSDAFVVSIDKSTNTVIDSSDQLYDAIRGSVLVPGANRIYGRSWGISPSDINYVEYDAAGKIVGVGESPYHGDYPGAEEVWAFDDGSRLVDSSGTIYSTDLRYMNSFLTEVFDIDFVGGDIPVVLSGDKVTAYNKAILPTGEAQLSRRATDVFVNDEHVIAFSRESSAPQGWHAELVPLSELSTPTPGEAIDPQGVPFTPDEIEVTPDGVVLLFSQQHGSVFQYDAIGQTWMDTIPLISSPLYMAYSDSLQRMFLAYDTGLIRSIDLQDPELKEEPFVTLPQRPLGLDTVGDFVFAVDASGAWESHYTFAPNGTQISAVEWNYGANDYEWSEVNRKIYFFRDGTSPNDLLWEEIALDGTIGTKQDSPLHGGVGTRYPISVAPNGSVVILGSGQIFDANTLERQVFSLGNEIEGIAWLGETPYTVRGIGGATQVQAWSPTTWAQTNIKQFSDLSTPRSLTRIGEDRLLLIAGGDQGVPEFLVLDNELNVVPRPIPVAVGGDDVQVDVGSAVALDGSQSFDPDQSSAELTYKWKVLSGPAQGQFSTPESVTTTFVAEVEGQYEIQLEVSDGTYASTDTLIVTYRVNRAPTAVISPASPEGVAQRSGITLSATDSTDPNGDALSYEWEVLAAPVDAQWQLTSATEVSTRMSADTPGSYTLRLTVSDGVLAGVTTKTVVFTANQAPLASTEGSQTTAVAGRTTARLDASRSEDPEGDRMTYFWRVVDTPPGATTTLSSPVAKSPRFSASLPGTYVVRLTVDDGLAKTSADVEVTIAENQTPVADASRSKTSGAMNTGAVRLDGTLSRDADDTFLTYRWGVVASSNASLPAISSRQQSVAYLNPTEPGSYLVELQVSDGASSGYDYVLVTIDGNQSPLAESSASDVLVEQGIAPVLDATGSLDPDGDALSYRWAILSSSNGTQPEIVNPKAAVTTMVRPDAGTYGIRLTVSDGLLQSEAFHVLTVVPASQPVPGDANGDGETDFADFLILSQNFGATDAAYEDGDFDGSGEVTFADFLIMADAFGR